MISLSMFTGLVVVALLVTALAPLLLVALLIRDWNKGELW